MPVLGLLFLPVRGWALPAVQANPPPCAPSLGAPAQGGGVPGWQVLGGKLHREFRFASFVEAFGFMAQVALIAEALGHHPEWSNVYDRVTMDLTTHDQGGIGALDREFARRVNALPVLLSSAADSRAAPPTGEPCRTSR